MFFFFSDKPLCDRAKHALEQSGRDLKDVLTEAGVHYNTWRDIVAGTSLRPRRLPELAKALRVRHEWLLSGIDPMRDDGIESNVADGPTPRESRLIPVVGRARGGDNGYFDEEQYPTGYGSGQLEVRSKDMAAFGLLIVGNSMSPRYRQGEYAVVEPTLQYEPGEDVYVSLKCGRKLIKELAWVRSDQVKLLSLNDAENPPLIIDRADVVAIYPCSPAPRRAFVPNLY